jgi:integrase
MSHLQTENPSSSTFPRTPPAITTEEVIEFLARCFQDPALSPIGHLARIVANTGMRVGELEGLGIGSIDLIRSRVEIPSHKSYERARYIPMRSKTLESLMELHTLNGESDFVLGSSQKFRICRAVSLLRSNKSSHNRARTTFHSLRQNFACRLHESGVPLHLVKYCLGHAQLPWFRYDFAMSSEGMFELLKLEMDCNVVEL